MSENIFNRLIIIGNGFDLAHGIKSSPKDFLLTYLTDSVNNFYQNDNYSDPLLEFKFNGYYTTFGGQKRLVTTNSVLNELKDIQSSGDYNVDIKSLLLNKAITKLLNLDWVDLEVEFFNVLIATRHVYKNNKQHEAISKVNDQLEFLKNKLVEYLFKQQNEFESPKDKQSYIDCFCENIMKDEIATVQLSEDIPPDNLYFVNFNYTNTLSDYINLCDKIIPSQINYIHGNLNSEYGAPIFGFGDELNKKFLEFEDDMNNDLFRHIKSFEYLKTKNYNALTRFIESNQFQVQIYGHSCGISDRTLLNQIFEHDNCKSIKVFYHKKDDNNNDFTDKSYDIARHFKSKVLLRKKLVPFDLSRAMPQPIQYKND